MLSFRLKVLVCTEMSAGCEVLRHGQSHLKELVLQRCEVLRHGQSHLKELVLQLAECCIASDSQPDIFLAVMTWNIQLILLYF